MDDGHAHGPDLGWAAVWGGALAGGGAIARSVQTPMTWRTFLAVLMTGVLFGAIGAVVILWQYPAVPTPVAFMAAAFLGFVSTHLSQLSIKIVEGLTSRLVKTIDTKADQFGLEKGDPPNGDRPSPAPGPGSPGPG